MMMNIINNLKHKFILLLLFGFSTLAYSQFEGGEPEPPEGDGTPASPIDGYIIYLAIAGLFVIYYTYKKSNRLVKN